MTLEPYLARKEKGTAKAGKSNGADCAWVIFCVEESPGGALTRRYLVIASMAAVSRERESGGGLRWLHCGTEESELAQDITN
jgi:hypothetical protein